MLIGAVADKVWIEVGKIIGLILVGVGLALAGKFAKWFVKWLKNRKLNPLSRAVRQSRPINDLLVSLRTVLNADRVYLVQFHNGVQFSLGNHAWFMTRTQETVREGVSVELLNVQGLPVQRLWDGIEPLFDPTARPGVYHLRCADCPKSLCSEEPTLDSSNHPPAVYYIVTRELAEGPFRRYLTRMGVVATAAAPIRDSKGNPVGFIGVDWCSGDFQEFDDRPQGLNKLCETAVRVQYELTCVR